MKRGTDPDAETPRDVPAWLPAHPKFVLSHQRWGVVRGGPHLAKDMILSPFPSRGVTSYHQWNVGRGTGHHWLVPLRSTRRLLHSHYRGCCGLREWPNPGWKEPGYLNYLLTSNAH